MLNLILMGILCFSSIVDFEHWKEAPDPVNMHVNEELQKWGLAQRAPPATWATEWGLFKNRPDSWR